MCASRARRTRVVLESASRHHAAEQPIVAIKIGGSLLNSPTLVERIEWLLSQRDGARTLLICGGGAAADQVRQWQTIHHLSDAEAHRLALGAMGFNEQLLESVLPYGRFVHHLEETHQAWADDVRPILRTTTFLARMDSLVNEPIDESWDFTSDSIAAWCGQLAGAEELILAKSVDLPEGTTLDAARNDGLVDRQFGSFRCPQNITWTNLRADEPMLNEWLTRD